MIVPRIRMVALMGVGVGALALFSAMVPVTTPVTIGLLLIFVAAAAADAMLSARDARGIALSTPPLLRAVKGRPSVMPVTLTNRGAAGSNLKAMEAALRLPPEFQLAEQSIRFGDELGRGRQITADATFRCTRRGEYGLSQCTVQMKSRFGMWDVRTALPIHTTVRVYPDLLSDQTAAEFLHRGKAGARVLRQAGKGREFEKLRDYLAGDPWDEIDWKATARRGRPVVRVFQVERTQEIYVAIDASRLSGRVTGRDGHSEVTLERYVQSALVMALAAEAQGDRFGLITFSDRVQGFVRASKGKTHFKTCREAIYELQPASVEADFGEFFAFLQTRLQRRALVIVLTALDDPLAGEMFSRHVAMVSRRHLVIAAMPIPEGVGPLFEGPVDDIAEVYERLGGHLRWRQLAELKRSCQRKGVALHLLDPHRVTGQLAGIYLDVKRRQAL